MDFKSLRENLEEKKANIPSSEKKIFDKKIKRVPVIITKGNKGYTVYIEGDKLDTYRSQGEAEKMAKEFVDEL